VTIQRPDKKNAIDLEMIASLAAQFKRWESDPEIFRVRIISAVPGFFSAGGDLAAFAAGDASGLDYQREFLREEYALLTAIRNSRLPTICELDGLAMGGGLGLAMACTARALKSGARFGMPELAIGLIPDVGASEFLSQAPGHQGLAMALTGYRATAADAVRWAWGKALPNASPAIETGAASTVLHTAAYLIGESDDVFDWYAQLAGLPGTQHEQRASLAFAGKASALAAAVCWELMRHEATRQLGFEARLRVELDLARRLTASGEFLRGIAGFLNRRAPGFAHGTLDQAAQTETTAALAAAWVGEALLMEQGGLQ